MPCENCPADLNQDVCITIGTEPELSYGVEFVGLSNDLINNLTLVDYRVCNCNPGAQRSGISHINFEICPNGTGPTVNITETLDENEDFVNAVEILRAGQEFAFPAVKLEFDPAVEPGQCVTVTIVYNGIFTQLEDGNVGVKIGGDRFVIGVTADSAFGLPLLACEQEFECPDGCQDLCETAGESTLPIPPCIGPTLPTAECFEQTVGDSEVLNYCVVLGEDDEAPVVDTCNNRAIFPTCNGPIQCCIETPYILFPSVTVNILNGTDVTYEGCEGETTTTVPCINSVTFENQFCFFCPDVTVDELEDFLAGEDFDPCDLVSFDDVNGTVSFVCPVLPDNGNGNGNG
ncbi:hypothetical protein ACOJQI_03345 [Bacillus salacetis]|uniref:hypothetical protein n=1 Tax=Bacillus salacetis TaxID=2315464 RepID=UPI003BA0DA33